MFLHSFCLLFFWFPFSPSSVAIALCLPSQMSWWLLLIMRAWELPHSVSIQRTHVYQVPVLQEALCGVALRGCCVEQDTPTCTESVCLAPPARPVLLCFVKTRLFLHPSSCCFSSSVYPSMGVYLSMCSPLITSHLIWPLLFINFLFSYVSTFNRSSFWRDREPPVLAPHAWPQF